MDAIAFPPIYITLNQVLTVTAFTSGPVCRGQLREVLSFLRPTVYTIIECPRFPGTITVAVRTGCALGHRATTIRACAHLMKTAVRYQLRAQGRSFVSWTQQCLVGSPSTLWNCWGKSRLPGKVPANGTRCERRDCVLYFSSRAINKLVKKSFKVIIFIQLYIFSTITGFAPNRIS